MNYQYPYKSNGLSNESSDADTFYSQDLESQLMSDQIYQEQQAGPSVPPEQLENNTNPYNGETFPTIPPALYEALYNKILQDVLNNNLTKALNNRSHYRIQ